MPLPDLAHKRTQTMSAFPPLSGAQQTSIVSSLRTHSEARGQSGSHPIRSGAVSYQRCRLSAAKSDAHERSGRRISPDFVKSIFRVPRDGICDPAVDVRFMPAGPVGADLDLRRERALGNLAIDGGTGQPGPGKNGFQADNTLRFSHGRAASCWLFVTASETDRTDRAGAQGHFAHRRSMAFKRRRQDRSNPEASASAKIDAVGESQLVAESAACFK